MPTTKRSKHNRKYYPWDKWLSRTRPITLEPNRDFTCTQESMAVMVRTRALEYQKRVTVNKNQDGSITIRQRKS